MASPPDKKVRGPRCHTEHGGPPCAGFGPVSALRVEALLLEGLAGGDDIPLTREFWKDLKSEAQQLAAKHKARKTP